MIDTNVHVFELLDDPCFNLTSFLIGEVHCLNHACDRGDSQRNSSKYGEVLYLSGRGSGCGSMVGRVNSS